MLKLTAQVASEEVYLCYGDLMESRERINYISLARNLVYSSNQQSQFLHDIIWVLAMDVIGC